MKLLRHSAILEIVRGEPIPSQEVLRERLRERGIDVAQATLSRDIRELGLVKSRDAAGASVYTPPTTLADPLPALRRLLPALFVGAEGVGNLLVVKTLAGGAQPVAAAIDGEQWDDVVGTIAGDDTILLIVRTAAARPQVEKRLEEFAGRH
ncbi:transcriptional regulator ArgR [soil metagenome]